MAEPTQADYFHGSPREALAWERHRRGYSRCPYCTGLTPGDWQAICDCGMADRVLGERDYPPPLTNLPKLTIPGVD